MKRVSAAAPLATFLSLLLVVSTAAFSKPDTRPAHGHAQGPDGVWNKVYLYTGGSYGLDPTGTVFDPSREQLVGFTHDWVSFQSISPAPGRPAIRIRDWAGSSVAYSAIYDPRRDRVIILTLDSLLFHVGTFALPLRDPIRWDRVVPFGASPNLSYASAIYDPVGDRMIVYGGMDVSAGLAVTGQVWSLSLGEHPSWSRIEPKGSAPTPRMDHTAIYDAEHEAVVVYGGRTALQGDLLGDVWSLDLAPKPHWKRLNVPGVAPGSRWGHAAIYDARWRRMIVMGGWPSWNPTSGAPYKDLWELSLDNAPRWRQLNPSGEAPGPFGGPLAFADAANERMILTSISGSLLWTLDWGGLSLAHFPGHDLPEPPGPVNPRSHVPPEMSLGVPSGLWRGGVLMARVSLAQADGAALTLFDAAGRRLWTVRPSALRAGPQDVAIAPASQVPSGVYFLRLQQGGRAQSVKLVKLR